MHCARDDVATEIAAIQIRDGATQKKPSIVYLRSLNLNFQVSSESYIT